MKTKLSIFAVVITCLLLTLTISCKKDPPKVIPTLTTTAANNIASTTATSGGTITNDGNSPITSRGVCWGANQSPTISDSKTNDGTGVGSFTSSITGLTPGCTYYMRAYATNAVGTAYGAQITITSISILSVLTTTDVLGISATSATSGGNISSDGGSAITARGVCWSTNQNPTTKDCLTLNGMGIGSFTSSISRLIPATTYYLKAYATNSIGTAYGNQVIFSTSATLPTITTTALSAVTSATATGGGIITNDGGSAVTARGVCWSTLQSPTILLNSKTADGAGTGSFTSSIIGLTPGTTYYVRAYATNSIGTVYGDQLTLTALALLPTITTTALSAVTSKTATGGGNITNDGGSAVTARGVCWSINQSPTISDNKTSNGTGTGTFTSSIISLNPYTTYYVRAYATNIAGTAYGTQVSFSTSETVTDIEGNIYNTVTIDKQVWMAENLRTIRYNDGTAIPLVTVNSDWGALTTPGYCWYNNDAATNKATNGAIYNWYTVNTGRLCPTGWHVPTYSEWTTLINYLGGPSVANNKLKATGDHWPYYVATNESGFTALQSGGRTCTGEFQDANVNAIWWSSTEYVTGYAWGITLCTGYDVIYTYFNNKIGPSVRCLRDY